MDVEFLNSFESREADIIDVVAGPIKEERSVRRSYGKGRRERAIVELRIGGHVSLRGRHDDVLSGMETDGFQAAQIFASSPRTWRTPQKQVEDFRNLGDSARSHGIDLYLHAIYLINLASSDDDIYQSSIHSLTWTMQAGAELGARAVISHVGSHGGMGFERARPRVSAALERVLRQSPRGPLLLMENSAGGGGIIGRDFEQLSAIAEDLGHPHGIGLCLDTAHAFAAGYDLRSPQGVEDMLASIDASMGIDAMHLVHVNDSKTELAGGRDRHENIGLGHIGMEGFGALLAREEIAGLPLVLETPHVERRVDDMVALRTVRAQTTKVAVSEAIA